MFHPVILAMAALLLVGFCVSGYMKCRQKNEHKQEARSSWNRRIQEAPHAPHQRLLVVMPAFDVEEAKRSIARLYEKAYIPQRVFVGLGTPVPLDDKEFAGEFHLQVQPVIIPSYLNVGAAAVRQTILQELGSSEPFVLLTHAHVVPLQDWDRVLLASLRASGSHVITQLPLETTSETVLLPDALPPTFAVLEPTLQIPPTFAARSFATAGHMHEAFAASAKCFFSSRDVVTRLVQYPVPMMTGSEDDFCLGYLCYRLGLRMSNPAQSVLLHVHSPSRLRSTNIMKSKKLRLYTQQVLKAMSGESVTFRDGQFPTILGLLHSLPLAAVPYGKWIGLQPGVGVAGRALLGLLPGTTQDEVLQKYGSEEAFAAARQACCYD